MHPSHPINNMVAVPPPQGAIPIVTPIGGDKPTVGSNAIALAMDTGGGSGGERCPFFLWDTGTAAMSWGEVQKLQGVLFWLLVVLIQP